jgi:predicted choloylglycine hydrolase
MHLHFNTISEPDVPGLKWKQIFDTFWPTYHAWLDANDNGNCTDLLTAEKALKKYMPKMWPTYEHLCRLTDNNPLVSLFLTGFQPPVYLSACSQAVINGSSVQLIRNYDYDPNLFEGKVLLSAWNGKKVIATSDSLIGVLDGMNEDGLVVSLTFGGRNVVGYGFGIPFILRYILEFCSTTSEAIETLISIPTHMSFNITIVDKTGSFKTVLISPDRQPIITMNAFTTNHQETIDWHENAVFSKTLERSELLQKLLLEQDSTGAKIANAFLEPPLYATLFEQGFGTLYTAIYNPVAGSVEFRWPNEKVTVSFTHFEEKYRYIDYKLKKQNQLMSQ